jgi:hypothetical protein
MIRAIALANNGGVVTASSRITNIIKEQVYLVEDSSNEYYQKYCHVYSLDNIYISIFRKEWFILESLHLGQLREKQIKSVLD